MKSRKHRQTLNGVVWSFRTARFEVTLRIERDRHYQYDGDDPEGETQAKLKSGEYVAFNSFVDVELDGVTVGTSALYGSVYSAEDYSAFWTDHRDADPMNRNCTIMRAAHPAGPHVSICHYFPDMIAEAISEARANVGRMTIPPRMRETHA